MADLFSITMTGSQETPDTGSTAFGYGSVVWDAAAQTATYHLVIIGLVVIVIAVLSFFGLR